MINLPETLPAALLDALIIIDETLDELELHHVIERSEENPNTFIVAAHDDRSYVNSGFVGWNEDKASVIFIGMDPEKQNQAELEGVDTADLKVGFDAKNVDGFLLHLTGVVREVLADIREKRLAEFSQDCAENP